MSKTAIFMLFLAGCGSAPSVDTSPVGRAIDGRADQLTRTVLAGMQQSSVVSSQLSVLTNVDWAKITVLEFVYMSATLEALRAAATSIEQFGRTAQALRTEQSGCTSDVICANIYQNMEVVFDRVADEMKRSQVANTKAIAFGSRANDVVASVMLVSAINDFNGQPGSYTDNFDQLVECVRCVTPPSTRKSGGGSTGGGGTADDPCGATGTWQISCPGSTSACGVCGTLPSSLTTVTISASTAKSGGSAMVKVNSATANVPFTVSSCKADFGSSACGLSAGVFGFSSGKPYFDVQFKCANDCKTCGSPSCTITKQ